MSDSCDNTVTRFLSVLSHHIQLIYSSLWCLMTTVTRCSPVISLTVISLMKIHIYLFRQLLIRKILSQLSQKLKKYGRFLYENAWFFRCDKRRCGVVTVLVTADNNILTMYRKKYDKE